MKREPLNPPPVDPAPAKRFRPLGAKEFSPPPKRPRQPVLSLEEARQELRQAERALSAASQAVAKGELEVSRAEARLHGLVAGAAAYNLQANRVIAAGGTIRAASQDRMIERRDVIAALATANRALECLAQQRNAAFDAFLEATHRAQTVETFHINNPKVA